ncbi:MAG: response regulator [Rhodobacteraceae bacterium]|nr:response regulator [Paracoccaceae bacterium]
MPTPLAPLPLCPPATAARPLAGMTVLVVEDSRLASEAVRLLCLKSGARIRRADSLRAARRHLKVYLPTAVIVDLGLPDGSGIDLIADLTAASPRISVILATSGDEGLFVPAVAAGADGVLAKPIESLAVFQTVVLDNLPPGQRPRGLRVMPAGTVDPDPIALRDDLAHIADVLTSSDDARTLDYVTHFLTGVARSAHDEALESAACSLAARRIAGGSIRSDLARVAGLLQDRIEGRQVI